MHFVCPACKGELAHTSQGFRCDACRLEFPILSGIPDFRLHPDPYIGIAEDRAKGEQLRVAAESRGFEAMLHYYYSITPDHPADLARLRIRHALAEVALAECALREAALLPRAPRSGALLDVGCSTSGLLVAGAAAFETLVGVDVAFRWLILGQVRLREAGIAATLVCANAEALPFPEGAFHVVSATDAIEHVGDAEAAVREAHRVLIGGGTTLWTTNNRYAPLPEPHVRLWGVGYLPRRWQRGYVARGRTDVRPYMVQLRSARELRRLFAIAGFTRSAVEAAPLFAPQRSGRILPWLLARYNRLRRVPGLAAAARWLGPRLSVRAKK